MWMLGPIGFSAPLLLVALAGLPILWLLLRAVPPAPIRRRFPGVALLLGLKDEDSQTDKTPWWLLLLRLIAVAAVIIGFAGPIQNPKSNETGSGPLLIVADGTWADARDWVARKERIDALLDDAVRAGRPVALHVLSNLPVGGPIFQSADIVQEDLPNLQPNAWEPQSSQLAAWSSEFAQDFDTFWLSDGLDRPGRQEFLESLQAQGNVTVFLTPTATFGLRPIGFENGEITATLIRSPVGGEAQVDLIARGLDPSGVERELVRTPVSFAAGAAQAESVLKLPPELRGRISRFEIADQNSAGAVSLVDDSLQRREVALISGGAATETLQLLSPLHYLREALEPTADLIEAPLADVIPANPDVIIFADVADVPDNDADALLEWVETGGMLLRFAGPRLAASEINQRGEDPLLPVRLRSGGRSVGGAMSWGDPKLLAPFTDGSPFFGLETPNDVTVTTQVMAQPDPTLAERVIAQLADGTPLVTRKSVGNGQLILFHVTANAEWSSLPLSGLFVQMLERLAVTSNPVLTSTTELEGTTWVPEAILSPTGILERVDTLPGVEGPRLLETTGPELPPGLYAGEDRRIAVNVIDAERALVPAAWPDTIRVEGLSVTEQIELKGWFLMLALVLLAVDSFATLALSGRLIGPRGNVVATAVLLAVFLPDVLQAQENDADAFAVAATSQVALAHIVTGDARVDEAAQAGLYGLSNVLYQRTAVEPAMPVAVNLETDELAFYPFLYWPITADQPMPSRETFDKLNRYLQTGGMILFDTRDADAAGFGSATPEGRRLQAIALGLDIPALEPVPSDHVLTRTFYLLQDFPGRYAGRSVWVEAAPPDAALAEGMPFRELNDGVTPVVIGGNDWAAAWATDRAGNPLYPVGRGMAGERQREIAYRFGVNLIMHVLTGNYKSDQVHVPDLLDRLGQ